MQYLIENKVEFRVIEYADKYKSVEGGLNKKYDDGTLNREKNEAGIFEYFLTNGK